MSPVWNCAWIEKLNERKYYSSELLKTGIFPLIFSFHRQLDPSTVPRAVNFLVSTQLLSTGWWLPASTLNHPLCQDAIDQKIKKKGTPKTTVSGLFSCVLNSRRPVRVSIRFLNYLKIFLFCSLSLSSCVCASLSYNLSVFCSAIRLLPSFHSDSSSCRWWSSPVLARAWINERVQMDFKPFFLACPVFYLYFKFVSRALLRRKEHFIFNSFFVSRYFIFIIGCW